VSEPIDLTAIYTQVRDTAFAAMAAAACSNHKTEFDSDCPECRNIETITTIRHFLSQLPTKSNLLKDDPSLPGRLLEILKELPDLDQSVFDQYPSLSRFRQAYTKIRSDCLTNANIHPELLKIIQTAETSTTTTKKSGNWGNRQPQELSERLRCSLRDAFSCPFVATSALSEFKQHIRDLLQQYYVERKSAIYSPYFTVIQSSGWGKSRLVFELDDIFVIYLRFPNGSDSTTVFPPVSPSQLLGPFSSPSSCSYQLPAPNDMEALISRMALHIKRLIWLLDWFRPTVSFTPRQTLDAMYDTSTGRAFNKPTEMMQLFNEPTETQQLPDFADIKKYRKSPSAPEEPISILLVLDEAHFLTTNGWSQVEAKQKRDVGGTETYSVTGFYLFRRALDRVGQELQTGGGNRKKPKLCAVLLSTNSSTALSPPTHYASSARLREGKPKRLINQKECELL